MSNGDGVRWNVNRLSYNEFPKNAEADYRRENPARTRHICPVSSDNASTKDAATCRRSEWRKVMKKGISSARSRKAVRQAAIERC